MMLQKYVNTWLSARTVAYNPGDKVYVQPLHSAPKFYLPCPPEEYCEISKDGLTWHVTRKDALVDSLEEVPSENRV